MPDTPTEGRASPVVIGFAINAVVKPSRDVMLAIASSSLYEDRANFRLRFFYGSPATTVENLVAFAESGLSGLFICGFERELIERFFTALPDHPPVVLGLSVLLPDAERQTIGRRTELVLDNARVGRMAADYFLQHGLRHFAFSGPAIYREMPSTRIRSEAFIQRIREKGGGQDLSAWCGGPGLEAFVVLNNVIDLFVFSGRAGKGRG